MLKGVAMCMVLMTGSVVEARVHSSSPSHKSHPASHAVDGNWRTEWISQAGTDAWLILDLERSRTLHGFVYIPRAARAEGRVVDYELYVSDSATRWGAPVKQSKFKRQPKAAWWPDKKEVFETIHFDAPVTGRYVKFRPLSEVGGRDFMAVGELQMIADRDNPPYKGLTMAHFKGLRYAPSVHMNYLSKPATAFYNEVTVERSSPGTYFMVCGWGGGYFGIQEKGKGQKVLLFSVWDSSSTNDRNAVPEEKRVKLLYKDEGTRVGRFGGEGTGGQSFYDLDWKVGKTCRLYMTASLEGERSVYTGYFFHPDRNRWIKMVSFSTFNKKRLINGAHSFLEDFRRNYESFNMNRTVRYSNTFTKVDGRWVAASKGRFTRDGNPHVNVDGGVRGNDFFLSTGGKIENKTCPLWKTCSKTTLPDVGVLRDLPE